MPNITENKAIVGRWFTEFWGKTCNLGVVDEIASADMLLRYSLHEPRRGRDDIKAFMTDFRKAFPDLNFWGTADLIAEGDYVVGRWEGGGTHTGPRFPISWPGRCLRIPDARCDLPVRQFSSCRTARSSRKSDWMMASLPCNNWD